MWINLQPEEMQIPITRGRIFGFVFSGQGVKPSPAKVQALKQMSPPTNAAEVQSLLGMTQY